MGYPDLGLEKADVADRMEPAGIMEGRTSDSEPGFSGCAPDTPNTPS